jgi:uncharacterized protein
MTKVDYILATMAITPKSINNTLLLLSEGASIPFIARYRKEMTGSLDEVQIGQVRDLSRKFDELIARQKTIITAIEEQQKLTSELQETILSCFDNAVLEDIYLPFKQKRQTKGDKARKLGLEPLAKMIMAQRGGDPEQLSVTFVKGEIVDERMALEGAMAIIAEWINEHVGARARIRQLFLRKSLLSSKVVKGKEVIGDKYKDYFDFSEPLQKCASHRFLALHRAEKEGIIHVKAQPELAEAIEQLERFFVKGNDSSAKMVATCCRDAYKRLMCPALENEVLLKAKEKADNEAIRVFSVNLKQLLLAPPLGSKRILAIDPGFRTGCKLVCLDASGNLLHNSTIYPHPPQNDRSAAQAKLAQLVQMYAVEAIAVGDGTAGRETEDMLKRIRFDRNVDVFVVREDGASIYSASAVARKEFPEYDVTVRGAISIGRRLMDPLAELVKIDPKSIGVGQYQHEVNQKQLKEALDDVVVSAVNTVGIDVNTASAYVLSYVSGLGPSLAENIVAYRKEHGAFKSRIELKSVQRLGEKAFEQASGFLRIRNGENPLDNTAVHPENYRHVQTFAKRLSVKVKDLIDNPLLLKELHKNDFPDIDIYTFDDLMKELQKPGLDPRKKAKVFEFDASIRTIEDLKIGMVLPGIVTNITAFGAFIALGIKENGLIHKSNLAQTFVDNPASVISLHDHVEVEIIELDTPRKRIGLKRIR